jgi:hypothetical protein
MANEEHLRILRSGVEKWNAWRKKNPDIEPDLKGANLQGMNLKGAFLKNANMSNADIRGIDFAEADLEEASLANCRAGLRNRWIVLSIIMSLIICILIVFFSTLLVHATRAAIENILVITDLGEWLFLKRQNPVGFYNILNSHII